jgi:hypothetical protein
MRSGLDFLRSGLAWRFGFAGVDAALSVPVEGGVLVEGGGGV